MSPSRPAPAEAEAEAEEEVGALLLFGTRLRALLRAIVGSSLCARAIPSGAPNSSDDDDMPTPDDDPHAEFTDDGAYYPDAMTAELVADGPSGRLSVMADDIDASQLLASVGIILAKGGR